MQISRTELKRKKYHRENKRQKWKFWAIYSKYIYIKQMQMVYKEMPEKTNNMVGRQQI